MDWGEQHPLMGGKSRRSRRSGTSEGGREGGYHMWGRAPTPHTWLPPTTGFPPAHSHKGVSPHTSLSSSKFRRRKSRAGVAPSLWCPNWHPAMSGICQKFETLVKALKLKKASSHALRMCSRFWVCRLTVGCLVLPCPT